jgi:YD repeat-containing protein
LDSYQYFDGLGRAIRSLRFDGNTTLPWIATDTHFDGMGRVQAVSNPYRVASPSNVVSACGVCTIIEFDSLGRIKKVATPDGAQVVTTYGAITTGTAGTTVTVADQVGKKRKSLTDAMGRLIQINEDPNDRNHQTSYSYDVLGNLRTGTQAVQTRTFVYDSLSRLTSATNPESGTVAYHYDNNSNLDWKTDARGVKNQL